MSLCPTVRNWRVLRYLWPDVSWGELQHPSAVDKISGDGWMDEWMDLIDMEATIRKFELCSILHTSVTQYTYCVCAKELAAWWHPE